MKRRGLCIENSNMHMKSYKLLFTLFFLATAIISYGQRESRDVGSFDEISLGTHADLYLTIGSKTSVELVGDEDDIDEIETEVVNGSLRIRNESRWGWNWSSDKVKIYITVPEIKAISVSGSGNIYGESTIKADDLELSISGSGNIELDIEATEASMTISGSGNAELEGSVKDLTLRISGSGSIEAESLRAEDAEVRISGSGSVEIYASESLEARIAGSGSVYYYGDPKQVDSSSAGSGKVKKRG